MNNDFVVNVNELVRKDYVKTMGNSVMGNLRKAVRLLFTSYMLFQVDHFSTCVCVCCCTSRPLCFR